jgi:hypothetical protein
MKTLAKTKPVRIPARDEKTKKFIALGETETALAAFESYYQMGQERAYAKVAAMYKVNSATIYNWSKKFGWKTRIQERNLRFANKLEDATTAQTIGVRVKYSNEFGKMIKDFLVYVEDRKREYLQDLRLYRALMKKWILLSVEQQRGLNAPKRPKPFVVIRDVSDLERIVKLQMLMLGEGEEKPKDLQSKEERLEALIKTDQSIRDIIAEAWRKTRTISLLQGGKAAQSPEKKDVS